MCMSEPQVGEGYFPARVRLGVRIRVRVKVRVRVRVRVIEG